jgi:hypothetical protein
MSESSRIQIWRLDEDAVIVKDGVSGLLALLMRQGWLGSLLVLVHDLASLVQRITFPLVVPVVPASATAAAQGQQRDAHRHYQLRPRTIVAAAASVVGDRERERECEREKERERERRCGRESIALARAPLRDGE